MTGGKAGCFNPVWSPDGAHIAYSSARIDEPMDSFRVYVVDATNWGTPRLVGTGGSAFLWINADELVAFTYDGRNPFDSEVQTSYEDKQIVPTKGMFDTKLALIDSPFK